MKVPNFFSVTVIIDYCLGCYDEDGCEERGTHGLKFDVFVLQRYWMSHVDFGNSELEKRRATRGYGPTRQEPFDHSFDFMSMTRIIFLC